MLSFAEFFLKKKIDLDTLQKAKPELYQEFLRDYNLMGEKSFDHSKKFWFNRLRKEYLLSEAEEVVNAPKNVEKSAEPIITESIATKPAGFKPKFKSNIIKASSSEDQQENGESPKDYKQEGYKPKFKPKSLETKVEKPEELKSNEPVESNDIVKPTGFKPRFKANITKTTSSEDTKAEFAKPIEEDIKAVDVPEENNTLEDQKKPIGFKPRFKANVTKTTSSEDTKAEFAKAIEEDIKAVDIPEENVSPQENNQPNNTNTKPIGFKPRFNTNKLPVNKNKEDDK